MTKLLTTVLIAVVLFAVGVYAAEIRGVKPADQHTFKGTSIECDGGKKVPISRVNDDFCDCKDGTDEPGTSACTNDRFFCNNVGFKGSYIPSSWVEDGLCDCCDGSDETQTKCPNTCKSAAATHLASVASEIQTQERGLAARDQMVATAIAERDRHVRLVSEYHEKVSSLNTLLNDLEATKLQAEAAYEAAKTLTEETIRANQDNVKAAQEGLEKDKTLENEAKDTDDTEHGDNIDHHGDNKDLVDSDPAIQPLKQEDDDASVWDEEDDESILGILQTAFSDISNSILDFFAYLLSLVYNNLSEKDQAVNAWNAARGDRDAAQRALDKYRKFLELDFGADMAYHSLYDNTLEFQDKEYTYKLNGFEDVLQTKPGHSSNLGRWKGWDEQHPNVMIFERGDRCWGAPDRSTRITVICGESNKLEDVKEPNKCEYTMTLRSPAACSAAALEALRSGGDS